MNPRAVVAKYPPPFPARSWGARLVWLLVAVAGAVIGFVVARSALFAPGSTEVALGRWARGVSFLGLPLVWLLVVGGHEAGHLLGGKLAGGRFLLYFVGPLSWRQTPTGIRFKLHWDSTALGGLAACPPRRADRLIQRQALLAAMGPVASLGLAGAAWLALRAMGDATGMGSFALSQWAWWTMLLSGAAGILTLWPMRLGGQPSDGAQICRAFDRRPEVADEAALLRASILSLVGERPRAWPAEVMTHLAGLDRPDTTSALGRLAAYSHFGDKGDMARAQAQLDAVLEREAKLPAVLRPLARAEYAWLLAEHSADAAAARAWLDSAGPSAVDPATVLLATAAVRAAEGEATAAQAEARAGLVALRQHSIGSVPSPWTRERLTALAGLSRPNASEPGADGGG